MCSCGLSPLPLIDDVPGVVSTCLPVATLCVCVWPCTLSLWNGLQELWSEKNQNIKRSCRPVPHAEAVWAAVEKILPHTRTPTEVLLLSLLSTEIREAGMREGLVMAELETDLGAL